jgi:hypothetical protein
MDQASRTGKFWLIRGDGRPRAVAALNGPELGPVQIAGTQTLALEPAQGRQTRNIADHPSAARNGGGR